MAVAILDAATQVPPFDAANSTLHHWLKLGAGEVGQRQAEVVWWAASVDAPTAGLPLALGGLGAGVLGADLSGALALAAGCSVAPGPDAADLAGGLLALWLSVL